MSNSKSNSSLAHCRKPDLILYSIIKYNEKFELSSNKFLYSGEGIYVDNFKNNKQIGTNLFNGTQYTSTEKPKNVYNNEQLISSFSDGSTFTTLFSSANQTDSSDIFIPGEIIIEKIICGTGKYTFKKGYMVIKVIDKTKRKSYVYFTK